MIDKDLIGLEIELKKLTEIVGQLTSAVWIIGCGMPVAIALLILLYRVI